MKVGDLVELSAYGGKHNDNHLLLGKRGLVVGQHRGGFYFKVHWFDSLYKRAFLLSRRELKHVKAKKNEKSA